MTKALLEYATKFAPMPPRTLAVLLLSAAFLLVEKDPTGPFRQLTDTYSHRRLLEEKVEVEDHEEFLLQTRHSHLPMFDSADFTVLGPSVFPKPSAFAAESPDDEIVINLKPTFGTHREDEDAVLIFAAEYSVLTYVLFFSTLRETGFKGDIVVAISKLDYKDRSVKEFLESDPHVIVYVIDFTCFNAEMEAVDSMKGGIRVCQAHKLYATKKGGSITPLPDPRNARTGQTTRYEIYWMWALQYSKHSWLMLVDVRDAVFQSNPFLKVPREPNSDREDGILLFFGENIEATRLGLSKKNRKWLTNAYGEYVMNALKDKPTICSGSTMGEQVAIETYLRAMVGESDSTGVVLMGADQGFHNYLYYSNKLANAKTIRSIIVQDQGSALINNLGALRTKELPEWGNGKLVKTIETNGRISTIKVFNWDGELSPVVHQFDRHKMLSEYWYKKRAPEYHKKWATQRKT